MIRMEMLQLKMGEKGVGKLFGQSLERVRNICKGYTSIIQAHKGPESEDYKIIFFHSKLYGLSNMTAVGYT